MSELINNREYRQQVLKEIISELHHGKSVDEVKAKFEEVFQSVSAAEIAEMEQALVREGLPVEEIQRLCDVHASVFKGSIEEIHQLPAADQPGHPVHTFKLENRALEELIRTQINPQLAAFLQDNSPQALELLTGSLNQLAQVEKHYTRKENLLFPFLEKYGITTPTQVMWGVDDQIRAAIKEAQKALANDAGSPEQVKAKVEAAVSQVNEMIFKEENILFPMALETLTEDEWVKVAEESAAIGFCLIQPPPVWKPRRVNVEAKAQAEGEKPADGYLRFPTGILSPEEIQYIFDTLPVDLTFVDRDGIVKYFSGKDRIFSRTKTVIGRSVKNCHPPASVHIVEKVIEDLQSGRKDHEDFWIHMGSRYVLIRYFAVRNEQGEFLGTLEVTQDIQPLQEISGEKRLLDEEPE